MSASIVRKALEVSEDTPGPVEKSLKNAGKKKLKSLQKKKKASADDLLKKNLKILKALEFASTARKYGRNPTELPGRSSSKSKKKNKEEKSVFTEEDFKKFEEEYFVTD